MKRFIAAFFLFLFVMAPGCINKSEKTETLFQASTIDALIEGQYDGIVSFKELRSRGDFGIGTFSAVDGEMIGLDGKFYRVRADGKVYQADTGDKFPFAEVTFFKKDNSLLIERASSLKELEEQLDKSGFNKNIFQAIKIKGKFEYIKTRSVPKQEKPYRKLLDIAKTQPEFTFSNVEGSLVGFYCPAYLKGIGVPGYRFHFITKDKKAGGHLLECSMENVCVEIDTTPYFFLVLPKQLGTGEASSKDKAKELEMIEK